MGKLKPLAGSAGNEGQTPATGKRRRDSDACMCLHDRRHPGMKGHRCRTQTVTTAIVPVARGSCGLGSSSISIFLMIVYKMTPKFISQP